MHYKSNEKTKTLSLAFVGHVLFFTYATTTRLDVFLASTYVIKIRSTIKILSTVTAFKPPVKDYYIKKINK